MANQRPVEEGVKLIYTGPGTVANAIVGPVSGNGYAPKVGEEQTIDERDVEGLLESGQWMKPPRKTRRQEVKQDVDA